MLTEPKIKCKIHKEPGETEIQKWKRIIHNHKYHLERLELDMESINTGIQAIRSVNLDSIPLKWVNDIKETLYKIMDLKEKIYKAEGKLKELERK